MVNIVDLILVCNRDGGYVEVIDDDDDDDLIKKQRKQMMVMISMSYIRVQI